MARYDYESKIVDIPDYPEPGVIFKDVMPLFADQEAFSSAVDEICDHFKGRGITKVVGSEARGFLIGAPVAYKLGVGFVPARKPGKLPRAVYSQSYSLEYGTNTVEMLQDALDPGDRVLVIDDLVATAGTTIASADLAKRSGATVVGFGFILELAFLNPREAIEKSYPGVDVFTLVKVD